MFISALYVGFSYFHDWRPSVLPCNLKALMSIKQKTNGLYSWLTFGCTRHTNKRPWGSINGQFVGVVEVNHFIVLFMRIAVFHWLNACWPFPFHSV